MATELERLVVTLEASTKKYENALNKASSQTKQKLNGMERDMQRFKQRAEGALGSITAGRMVSSIAQVGAALGVAFGGREIIAFADAWTNLENRLRSSGVEDTAKGLETVKQIAADSRTDIEAVGELFARLAAASDSTGMSLEETASATKALAQALQVDGASAQEAASTLRQFSQALTSGVLRGEEFNAIAENSNSIMMALMKATGASRAELRAMAGDGKITGAVLKEALKILEADVGGKFAASTKTVSQALTQMRNEFIAMVGDANKATGSTRQLVKIIEYLTQNLGAVTTVIAAVGAAIATAFAAKGIASVAALAARIGAIATAVNPVTAAILAVAAAIAGLVQLAGGLDEILQSIGADFNTTWGDVAQVIGTDLYNALVTAKQVAIDAFTSFQKGLESVGIRGRDVANTMILIANTLIGAIRFAVNQVMIALEEVPRGIAATMTSTVNMMTSSIIGALNSVIEVINYVIEKFNDLINGIQNLTGKEFTKINAVNLIDEKSFTIAGENLAQWAARTGDKVGQNFEQSFIPYIQNIGERANKIAEGRTVRLGDAMATGGGAPAKPRPAVPTGGAVSTGGGKGKQSVIDQYREETQELIAQSKAMQMLTTTGYAAEAQLKMLTDAMKNGATVTEAQKKQIEQVALAYGEVQSAMAATEAQQQQMAQLQQTLAQGFEEAFMSIIEGSSSAADAFKNMAKQILAQIIRMQIQSAMSNIFGGGATGGGGGFFGAIGKLFGFAGGGPVSRGNPVVVGENGPEILVPNRNSRIMPNRALKSSGGGTSVVVNNNAPVDVQTRKSQGASGQNQVEIIVNEIDRRISRGQYDKSLGSRFNLKPSLTTR